MKTQLYAPKEYWQLTGDEKSKICNGAGPKGYGWLVPDTIWGLKITEAANIHDYMYAIGKLIEDKEMADRVFMENMVRIIYAKTKFKPLLFLRLQRAEKYYKAVRDLGGMAFWHDKNLRENLGEVTI